MCDIRGALACGWKADIDFDTGLQRTIKAVRSRMRQVLAVCLPLTSRGYDGDMDSFLTKLGNSLDPARTHCYIAVDTDDSILSNLSTSWFKDRLNGCGCTKITLPQVKPVSLYLLLSYYSIFSPLIIHLTGHLPSIITRCNHSHCPFSSRITSARFFYT